MEGTHFTERKEEGEKTVFLQAGETQCSSAQDPSIHSHFLYNSWQRPVAPLVGVLLSDLLSEGGATR